MLKLLAVSSLATLFGAALITQTDAPAIIKSHVATLHAAKSFKAELMLRKLSGGSPDKETVSYSKDGMFKIESAKSLAVSDGKTVWILNKEANTYTEAPASLARTKESDVWAWAAFFNEEAFKGVKEYSVKGSRNLPGGPATEVSMKLANDKEVSLFIDSKTGVAKGAMNGDWIIIGSNISMSKDAVDAKDFAFAAPAGAKKEEPKPVSGASFADVQKILVANCQGCHNDGNPKGRFSVDSYAGIMRKVTAGDAANSALYRSISGPRPKMPAGGAAPLSKADQDSIAGWINAGAKNE